LTTKGIS